MNPVLLQCACGKKHKVDVYSTKLCHCGNQIGVVVEGNRLMVVGKTPLGVVQPQKIAVILGMVRDDHSNE